MIDDATALILTGGDSRRMGRDKATLVLDEQVLWRRIAETLRAVFPHVLLSVRRPRAEFDLPQVCDAFENAGPLAGVCAGLEAAATPWVFAVATDMPFLEPRAIELLATRRGGYEAVVPVVGGHPQPLAAFYAVECASAARALLKADGPRRLRAFLERLRVCRVDESELRGADPALRSFIDLDTPQDLDAARGESSPPNSRRP